MSGPSQYVRQKREEGARRRLEIAKLLRDDPTTTNKQLASALNVNRNTITLDRKEIVEQLKRNTLSETEQLRADMVGRLEALNTELELHRRDGKLPTSVIHEMLLVHRSLIELLGIRKPVTEHLEVRKRTISFSTVIKSEAGETQPKLCELTVKQLALTEGSDEQR
jgi:DNA-binding XRE family transcriptional regulator